MKPESSRDKKIRWVVSRIVPVLLMGLIVIACRNRMTRQIQGAGATFPYPLYSKMFYEYNKQTGIQVNYQAIGSGGGIRQLEYGSVDFGATDAPMSDAELRQAPAPIVHIPICLGAVAITYNLPGKPSLRLTPQILSGMYLGKITRWNDSRIRAANPGVTFPDLKITVIHRSDGSGTTYVFSDYLARVNPVWKREVGRGKSLNWPVGLGGKGNPGVAGFIEQTPGSIGYVELIYSLQNKMPVALLQNKSGNYISPSLESVRLAANTPIPADARVSITNTDAAQGYPISSFTYILLSRDMKLNVNSMEKAKAVVDLIWWMIHKGQKYTEPLYYVPLPDAALKVAEDNLESIVYNGKPVLDR